MCRIGLLALCLGACGLLLAGVVGADPLCVPPFDPPNLGNCTVPSFIDIVGRGPDAQPDSTRGKFVVTVRDLGNNPMPGVPVTVSLCDCRDLEIDSQQLPSLAVNGESRSLSALTDASGTALFCIVGAGENTGGAQGPGLGCAKIYICGSWYLGSATATVTDENGRVATPGVEPMDLRACLIDWGSGTYFGRSDFDHDGSLSILDFRVLLKVLAKGTSIFGPNALCQTYCP